MSYKSRPDTFITHITGKPDHTLCDIHIRWQVSLTNGRPTCLACRDRLKQQPQPQDQDQKNRAPARKKS